MRLEVTIDGDLERWAREEIDAAEKAVTLGVEAAGDGLKDDWRQQIKSAGLGTRLGNTIRSERYPWPGYSLGAASLVYSRASKIVHAFEEGSLIRSDRGLYLAIPTPAAGPKGVGRKKITPLGFERRTGLALRFVYRRGKPSLLVIDQARINKRGRAARKGGRRRKKDNILTGEQTVVAFILVPQVKIRKRLNLERDTNAWLARLPGLIISKWPDGRSNG